MFQNNCVKKLCLHKRNSCLGVLKSLKKGSLYFYNPWIFRKTLQEPFSPSNEKLFTKTNNFQTEIIKPHIDLENWMGQLPDHLIKAPIIYLSIPGKNIYVCLQAQI